MTGHVVIAPDKFRGSLTAPQVAAHVAAGLAAAGIGDVVQLPVADGGEGTVDAVVACGFTRVTTEVTGPTGARVPASYAIRDDDGARLAVVELAEASGLRRLPLGERHPRTATSRGTGELIAHAVRHGATRVVLGLGGSACTDGGAGMLRALGARLLDGDGEELPAGGAALRNLHTIDLSGLLRGFDLVIATDVDNPLLGPYGAAAVYSPQKGASPDDVAALEAGLARLAEVTAQVVGDATSAARPGAGAAGGTGFAALAFLGAEPRPGIAYLLELLEFDRVVEGAALVITGEGSIDEQSLRGKAPVGVAAAAAKHGVPLVAVCGRRSVGEAELRAAGIEAVYPLTDLEPDVERCIANAGPLLDQLARTIAAAHLSEPGSSAER